MYARLYWDVVSAQPVWGGDKLYLRDTQDIVFCINCMIKKLPV